MKSSHLATLVMGGAGVILLLSALGIEYIKSNQKVSGNTFTATESATFSRQLIKVDIEGAVQRPGIYEIPNDSRIQDVLITAGGLIAKADRMTISRTINLAQRLYDGQKVYIPELGLDTNPNLSNSTNLSNLVNINTATEAQLDTLSGVGPVTAGKIISGRPYQTISDLITKHLVGQSVYDKIKDTITVN